MSQIMLSSPQLTLSFDVTGAKDSATSGTVTWKLKSSYIKPTSDSYSYDLTIDGESESFDLDTKSWFVWKTETVSPDSTGYYNHTYTVKLTYQSGTGIEQYSQKKVQVVIYFYTDSAPTLSIDQHITRAGMLVVNNNFYNADFSVSAAETIYLDQTLTLSGTSTAGAYGYLTSFQDVSAITAENNYYGYVYEATTQGGSQKTSRQTGLLYRPSRVYGIDCTSQLILTDANPTKNITAKAYGINHCTPEVTTLTYSSTDITVAQVNSSTGAVTKVGNGTTTITITSADSQALVKTATVTVICLESIDFPVFPTGDVIYLDANLMQDIIDAQMSIASDNEIILPYSTADFNSFSTHIKKIYTVCNNSNLNIKYLCDQLGVSYSLADFGYDNTGAKWHKIINEWIRVLNAMHNL